MEPSRRESLGLGVFTSFAFLSCKTKSLEQSPKPIRLAVPGNSFLYLPIILAEELQHYRDVGLNVMIEAVGGGGSKTLQALAGGSVDVAAISLDLAIQMTIEGRPVKMFLSLIDRPGYVLVIAPASKRRARSVKDLEGGLIGVSSPGSGSHNFANFVLNKNGVSPGNVSFIGIGLGSAAIAAFERNQLDAAVLTGNAVTTVQQRFPKLVVVADARTSEGVKSIFGSDLYPGQGLGALPDWLIRNPDTARKLASALLRTMRYMRQHSLQEILERIPAQYRAADPTADIQALRELIPMLSKSGTIAPAGAQVVKSVLDVSYPKVRAARLTLSETYTNEYVQPN
jgi:NitT/TauT family transport system substrate-binding protein